ncbi:MAG: alginate lyase family protein, partial [Deltaproteobacteria bacterium]|nr:alginate lyase family protein [Deltaproteobacteria bacterium]
EAEWYGRLIREAEQLVRHKFSFFNLKDHYLGNPIDWNRDHASGKKASMLFAPSIDYRDFQVTGDCKLVWEPNRHHQLVVLGRAYRAGGDIRYAEEVVRQIESWLRQCPFGRGMNWRSPMELAIRLINWVWAIDLIRDSGALTGELRKRVLYSVYLHLWEITRKYSRGSSANNHLIGEAAGVFIATNYFSWLPDAPRWRKESRNILSREIIAQTYADGCTQEQALGYQLFVLQFFLVAGIVARRMGYDFPNAYWSRLEKMLEFVGALDEGGGNLTLFGDCDDGYVLDLGNGPGDVDGLLSVGAVLFGHPGFKNWAGSYPEVARWLLGGSSREQFAGITELNDDKQLESRAFPEAGYYLLQCGTRGSSDRVSILFDCGALGFKSIAAHGHADALSFTLRAFGVDVFVDPGTYDYFSFPEWREYFRSTRAHNTIVVDGIDQSEMSGSFMWGRKADARCIRWEPREGGGSVKGEHDGYARLKDPVVHRRTLNLDGESGTLTIRDEIVARETHEVSVYFHVSEFCSVSGLHTNTFEIAVGEGTVTLEMDQRLTVSTLTGSEKPIGGWVSRGYHQKVPGTTITGSGTFRGKASLVCRVKFGLPTQF